MMTFIHHMARWSALTGGVLLALLTVLVVVSVIGRSFSGMGLGPVPGDYELVEMGVGVAIFFFMPWCYLQGGHGGCGRVWWTSTPTTKPPLFCRCPFGGVLLCACWVQCWAASLIWATS